MTMYRTGAPAPITVVDNPKAQILLDHLSKRDRQLVARDAEVMAWVQRQIDTLENVPWDIRFPKRIKRPRKIKKILKRQAEARIRMGVFGKVLTAPIRERLDYAGFCRSRLMIEPLSV